jgi:glycosyltransferase involved in cell wall biosynthesis
VLEISVVIPTCNRRERVLALLGMLARSTHPLREVLVVDSSDRKLTAADLGPFSALRARAIEAPRSVCIQRNIGIGAATSPWIFLCDDDYELPADYVARLAAHAAEHPEAGAVSGLHLEGSDDDGWRAQFPESSDFALLWKYMFKLALWGELRPRGRLARAVAARVQAAGNHLAKSGWPVIVAMDGPFFRVPIYGLGASLVKRSWLLESPYDESLDSHGLGDNYGVAIGFPEEGIHIVTGAQVRHHKAKEHRLAAAAAVERRLLALHYFIRTREPLAARGVRTSWFMWSLLGAATLHGAAGQVATARAFGRAFWQVARGRNPYLDGRGAGVLERPEARAGR